MTYEDTLILCFIISGLLMSILYVTGIVVLNITQFLMGISILTITFSVLSWYIYKVHWSKTQSN